MLKYKTIEKEAEAEQNIRNSKFIGCARPVENLEEADAFFKERRTIHKFATHNVPAYVIGLKQRTQWASDDGEPQGTSGAAIMQMLEYEGVTNAAMVVTRYYGGVKLGTGGLVRAYTGTAMMALQAAGLCHMREEVLLGYRIDYSHFGKLKNLSLNGEFRIVDTEFNDKVTVILAAEITYEAELVGIMADLTSGDVQISRDVRIMKVRC